MKINGSVLVAVAMMIGSVAVTGCNSAKDDNAIAPEESVASAPTEETSQANDALGFAHYGVRVHYYAPHAPPVARYEVRGRAPSARHFWAPGYYRWNGREHVWIGGRWELRRDRYDYVSPRWQAARGRWEYVPGYWVRRY